MSKNKENYAYELLHYPFVPVSTPKGGYFLNRFLRGLSVYLLIAIVAVFMVNMFYRDSASPREVVYTEFMDYANRGQLESARMIGGQRIEGKLHDGSVIYAEIPYGTLNLADRLYELGISVSAKAEKDRAWWWSFLPTVFTIVVVVVLWLFLINQMQGSGNKAMSFGKSRAKMYSEEKSRVTFNDVAGLDEAKQELLEIVEFLRQPKKFVDLGAKIPKGVLLVGPPGTGKTLLARAVAGEAGVPFFSISGSDFVEMFVGVGASRVRDLFDTAKKNSPCIVFIDELDAVGRQRGAGLGGGHDEREQTLNQLLVEMDGFESNTGIIIMAATNRPDVLDPALLRPGRFDRRVVADVPDVRGREEILRIHARGKPLAEDVDLKVLAKRTPYFSGADLENLMNEAAILAARRGLRKVTMAECEEATDRVMMGPENRKRVLSEKDKLVFAYHEAGHALLAHFLPHADPLYKVTIIGRGRTGGHTATLPVEERYVTTKSELLDDLAVLLGGRAAEELAFDGEVSTGAQNDLERSTKLARKMVTEWGMSEKLGPLTFGRSDGTQVFLGRDLGRDRDYSENVAAQIDQEVRGFVEGAHKRAGEVLTSHKRELDNVVEALLERETLNCQEFELAMEHGANIPEDKSQPSPVQEPSATKISGGTKDQTPVIQRKHSPAIEAE
jgi:cell division protease FtsH